MEPSRLRSIVAFSAAATLLYTPLFKKLTAIKNATVATVIALAPLAGALAAGAVSRVHGWACALGSRIFVGWRCPCREGLCKSS
jgi:4-hydroxybenzoate polyprenyltransferase